MTARSQLLWLPEWIFYQKHAKCYYIIKKEKKDLCLLHQYDCVATVFTALLINWVSRLQFFYCLIRKKLHTGAF